MTLIGNLAPYQERKINLEKTVGVGETFFAPLISVAESIIELLKSYLFIFWLSRAVHITHAVTN